MFKFKRHFILAMVVAICLSAGMAIAKPTIQDMKTAPETGNPTIIQNSGREDVLIDKLNLDDTQKKNILAIRESYKTQMQSKYASIQAANETMQNLITNSNTSRAQLESQHQIVASLRQELSNLRFQQMMDIRDILTPVQREEFRQHMGQKQDTRFWRSK